MLLCFLRLCWGRCLCSHMWVFGCRSLVFLFWGLFAATLACALAFFVGLLPSFLCFINWSSSNIYIYIYIEKYYKSPIWQNIYNMQHFEHVPHCPKISLECDICVIHIGRSRVRTPYSIHFCTMILSFLDDQPAMIWRKWWWKRWVQTRRQRNITVNLAIYSKSSLFILILSDRSNSSKLAIIIIQGLPFQHCVVIVEFKPEGTTVLTSSISQIRHEYNTEIQ